MVTYLVTILFALAVRPLLFKLKSSSQRLQFLGCGCGGIYGFFSKQNVNRGLVIHKYVENKYVPEPRQPAGSSSRGPTVVVE